MEIPRERRVVLGTVTAGSSSEWRHEAFSSQRDIQRWTRGTRQNFDRQTLQRDVTYREKVLKPSPRKGGGGCSGDGEWSGFVSSEGQSWEILGENLEGPVDSSRDHMSAWPNSALVCTCCPNTFVNHHHSCFLSLRNSLVQTDNEFYG